MTTGIPVGATVTRVYWRVPDSTGYGRDHDTHQAACDEARTRKNIGWRQRLTDNRVWIDERWTVEWQPREIAGHGGKTDLLVQRTEYAPTETHDQWVQKGQSI